MSPILVRPVREQLEHDRLIRYLLLNKYKRRFEANGNTGDERTASVKIGLVTLFPDIVLTDGKKLTGIVEVETGESVNNLEALAEWVHFAKARVPFYLYIPVNSLDSARRLCEVHQIHPTEIWSYRGAMEGFDLVRVQHNPSAIGTTRTELIARPVVKPLVPDSGKPVPEVKTSPAVEPKPVEKVGKPAKVEKPIVAAKPPKADKPVKAEKPPTVAKPVKPEKPVKRAPETKPPKKPVKAVAKPAAKAKAAKSKPSVKSSKKKR